MKKCFVLLITLFYCNENFSENKNFENQKIKSLIQVWGLLKYKHPKVSKGFIHFDNEFIKEYNKIESFKTQEEFNNELSIWIKSFNSDSDKTKNKTSNKKNYFTKNEDYSWFVNSNFNNELIKQLNILKNNKNYGKHYGFVNKMSSTIDFNNDENFKNFDNQNQSHRILFLASFWNKMRYWNVNIYLTETKWNHVLLKVIPNFLKEGKENFEIAKDKLFSYLDDSHSNYNYSKIYNNPKRKVSLYGGRIVNDSLVIKTIFNSELAKLENIELGDIIFSVNNKPLKKYYKEKFSDRISSSNDNYLRSFLEKYYLLSDTLNTIKVRVLKKNGKINNQTIKLYKYNKNNYKPESLKDTLKNIKWINLKENIGYINLKTINKSELKKSFKEFKNHKGIIIDLRNYPRNINATDIPSFLYPKKKVFMKLLTSVGPSVGKYDTQSALKIIKNPFAAGKKNRNYFKGKIILLVDRNTGSMAEYFAMAIQNSPNCLTVGEQTFGAVMNRNEVILKDNTKIDYTSTGAFYPNDVNVQRAGLKIDYIVNDSAKKNNTYVYIDYALELIMNGDLK